MKEYIEREALLNHLSCNPEIRFFRVADADGTWVSARDTVRVINKLPAADVVECKRGEWVHIIGTMRCSCSQCGHDRNVNTQFGWKFCPNCGSQNECADMREVTHD